jgi:hypothetical protein
MAATAQTVSIQLDGGAFRVVGWRAPAEPPAGGWSLVLVIRAGTGDVPPLAGRYVVDNGTLVFHPTYPIAAGIRYRATFHPPDGGAAIDRVIEGPARSTTLVARVDRVFPSTDVLPSNQLRLYIYFSAPMSRGEAAARLRILNGDGKALAGIFLPGEELWDPGNTRLTLTFDPGRIKRGLESNEKMGPPIADGARYTLVIDREWLDARGVPLVGEFRKAFRGGPAVRSAPDPKEWRITAPHAVTSESLIVTFPRPMNYPLLQRMLRVASARGAVAGDVSIEHQETEWRFTPHEAWAPGPHHLVVDTALEDLAGNHIGQLFDIDVFNRVTEHITTQTVAVPFDVVRK